MKSSKTFRILFLLIKNLESRNDQFEMKIRIDYSSFCLMIVTVSDDFKNETEYCGVMFLQKQLINELSQKSQLLRILDF